MKWLLIVVFFSHAHNHLMWSETHYLDSKEQCEHYAEMDLEELRKGGVKTEHMNYECLQVVVPK